MMRESSFYTKLYEGDSSALKQVQCNLCGRMCKILNEAYDNVEIKNYVESILGKIDVSSKLPMWESNILTRSLHCSRKFTSCSKS